VLLNLPPTLAAYDHVAPAIKTALSGFNHHPAPFSKCRFIRSFTIKLPKIRYRQACFLEVLFLCMFILNDFQGMRAWLDINTMLFPELNQYICVDMLDFPCHDIGGLSKFSYRFGVFYIAQDYFCTRLGSRTVKILFDYAHVNSHWQGCFCLHPAKLTATNNTETVSFNTHNGFILLEPSAIRKHKFIRLLLIISLLML